MPELPPDFKSRPFRANGTHHDPADTVVALTLAFDEVLMLQAITALAARDPRFRIVPRLGDATLTAGGRPGRRGAPGCVALVDGRNPPQHLTRVLQHRDLIGCVILTERHSCRNGTVRLPFGARHTSLPWGAPWGAVADALIDAYKAGAGGDLRAGDQCSAVSWEAEHARLYSLTERERQVMRLIAEGMAVRDIAERLHLAQSTIDNHKSRLMKKIGVKKSVDIVRFACRMGVLTP